ncbi:tyrosine-protein phosphatase [Scopulibacillus cellulosilyticus]|uniref:Tyrosine-protein phosphatase n=1 Tax=Scopulibacillus cellulosilyticus TaxID=2665665 RepID=A0ABW2PU99_9BACL
MIDIHSHILPNVDDGAANEAESIKMAKEAVKEGITHIIATPHHRNRNWKNNRTKILNDVDQLNQLLVAENITLKVLPGQETRIYGDMVEGILSGELLTQNDGRKYIFVEFPSNHVPRFTKQLFFDMQQQDIIPIIVHPERNSEIAQNSDILYQLVKGGALTQVTAACLCGKFGKKIKKLSLQMIENNLTHFIASDAHNTTMRNFYMQEAFEIIDKEFGSEYRYLFLENAQLLVNGEMVYKEEPIEIIQKKFLGLF